MEKDRLIYKKLIIIHLLIFFSILIVPFCSANSEFHSTVILTVNEDSTYDFLLIRSFDTDYYGTKNWTMSLGSPFKDVQIYDDFGNITILNKNENKDYTDYTFDTNYRYGYGYRPIYFSSKGNSLIEINEYLYRVEFGFGSFGSNEKMTVNVSLPESINLISLKGYDKLDFDYKKRNLNFVYDNPDGLFRFTLIKNSGIANFSEITYDNKLFFIERNEILENAVNRSLNDTPLIFNYPIGEKDFIIIAISNLSALNISAAGGVYEYDGLILINKDKFSINGSYASSEDNVLLTFFHEFTHYSNSFITDSTYPTWLEEGSAVYSNIKYVEKYSHDSKVNALSPTIKISISSLENWYFANRTIESLYANVSEYYLSYPVYGFLVNNYAKSYGEERLEVSLNEIRNKKLAIKDRFLSDQELEDITINSFISNSGQNLTEEDILFPDKKLLFENKTAFEDKMKNFTFQGYNRKDYSFSQQFSSSEIKMMLIGIIAIIIIIGLPIILLVLIIKFIRKKKNKK
jgi:hypothetical protein